MSAPAENRPSMPDIEPATDVFPVIPAQRSAELPPARRSRRGQWIALAIALVILTVIGTAVALSGGSTPTTTPAPGAAPHTSVFTAPTTRYTPPPTTAPAAVDPLAPTTPAVYTGTGSDVVAMNAPVDDIAVVKFECPRCTGNVVLKTDTNDLLVNEIGKYSGQMLVNERSAETISRMQVTATGSWTLTVGGLSMAQIHNSAAEAATGTGDDVVIYRSGPDTARLTHTGDSNFAVWAYGLDGSDLLVNEIGSYQGTVMLPASSGEPVIVEVTADGKWTFTPQ